MAKVLIPRIRSPGKAAAGGRAYSSSGDGYGERLQKYIPLRVSAVFPVLDSALATYVKTPVAGLAPLMLNELVFGALLVLIGLDVHDAYNKKGLSGAARWRLQAVQTVFNLIAFILWSYTVKGFVWGGTNNPALVIILDALFLLFAAYLPSVSPGDTVSARIIAPAVEVPEVVPDEKH